MSSSRLIVLPEDELKEILEDLIADVFDRKFAEKGLEQTKESEDELLSIKSLAKYLGLSEVSLHRYKKNGVIPFYRFGGRVFFKKSEVLESLKKVELNHFKKKTGV